MEKNADTILGTTPGAPFVTASSSRVGSAATPDPTALQKVITASVRVKADVVSQGRKRIRPAHDPQLRPHHRPRHRGRHPLSQAPPRRSRRLGQHRRPPRLAHPRPHHARTNLPAWPTSSSATAPSHPSAPTPPSSSPSPPATRRSAAAAAPSSSPPASAHRNRLRRHRRRTPHRHHRHAHRHAPAQTSRLAISRPAAVILNPVKDPCIYSCFSLVILSNAKNPRICLCSCRCRCFASEIGPGFSPDISRRHNTGFSP